MQDELYGAARVVRQPFDPGLTPAVGAASRGGVEPSVLEGEDGVARGARRLGDEKPARRPHFGHQDGVGRVRAHIRRQAVRVWAS